MSGGDAVAGLEDDPQTAVPAAGVINQTTPLEVVAQQESTRSYFLAQTLESTKTVPIVSANLPLDKGTSDEVAEPETPAEGDGSSEDEGGDDSDESDPGVSDGASAVTPGVSAESTVVGSFEYRGITYAVEPGGEAVAVVAADYAKLPQEFIEAQTIVLPSMVTVDGADYYTVSRIADRAFAGINEVVAVAAQSGEDADAPSSVQAQAEAYAYEDGATPKSSEADDMADDVADDAASSTPEDAAIGIIAITVPASIVEIGDDAFTNCDTLQYVIVSEDNPNYSMYDGCLYDADQTSLLLIPEGRLGAVRIPSTAVNISEDVSSHCAHLTTFIVDADSAASQLLAESDETYKNAKGRPIDVLDAASEHALDFQPYLLDYLEVVERMACEPTAAELDVKERLATAAVALDVSGMTDVVVPQGYYLKGQIFTPGSHNKETVAEGEVRIVRSAWGGSATADYIFFREDCVSFYDPAGASTGTSVDLPSGITGQAFVALWVYNAKTNEKAAGSWYLSSDFKNRVDEGSYGGNTVTATHKGSDVPTKVCWCPRSDRDTTNSLDASVSLNVPSTYYLSGEYSPSSDDVKTATTGEPTQITAFWKGSSNSDVLNVQEEILGTYKGGTVGWLSLSVKKKGTDVVVPGHWYYDDSYKEMVPIGSYGGNMSLGTHVGTSLPRKLYWLPASDRQTTTAQDGKLTVSVPYGYHLAGSYYASSDASTATTISGSSVRKIEAAWYGLAYTDYVFVARERMGTYGKAAWQYLNVVNDETGLPENGSWYYTDAYSDQVAFGSYGENISAELNHVSNSIPKALYWISESDRVTGTEDEAPITLYVPYGYCFKGEVYPENSKSVVAVSEGNGEAVTSHWKRAKGQDIVYLRSDGASTFRSDGAGDVTSIDPTPGYDSKTWAALFIYDVKTNRKARGSWYYTSNYREQADFGSYGLNRTLGDHVSCAVPREVYWVPDSLRETTTSYEGVTTITVPSGYYLKGDIFCSDSGDVESIIGSDGESVTGHWKGRDGEDRLFVDSSSVRYYHASKGFTTLTVYDAETNLEVAGSWYYMSDRNDEVLLGSYGLNRFESKHVGTSVPVSMYWFPGSQRETTANLAGATTFNIPKGYYLKGQRYPAGSTEAEPIKGSDGEAIASSWGDNAGTDKVYFDASYAAAWMSSGTVTADRDPNSPYRSENWAYVDVYESATGRLASGKWFYGRSGDDQIRFGSYGLCYGAKDHIGSSIPTNSFWLPDTVDITWGIDEGSSYAELQMTDDSFGALDAETDLVPGAECAVPVTRAPKGHTFRGWLRSDGTYLPYDYTVREGNALGVDDGYVYILPAEEEGKATTVTLDHTDIIKAVWMDDATTTDYGCTTFHLPAGYYFAGERYTNTLSNGTQRAMKFTAADGEAVDGYWSMMKNSYIRGQFDVVKLEVNGFGTWLHGVGTESDSSAIADTSWAVSRVYNSDSGICADGSWYRDAACTDRLTEGDYGDNLTNENHMGEDRFTDLYWKPDTVSVLLNPNQDDAADSTVYPHITLTSKAPMPTQDISGTALAALPSYEVDGGSYRFDGYWTAPVGGVRYYGADMSSAIIWDTDSPLEKADPADDHYTLYAHWVYDVSFDTNTTDSASIDFAGAPGEDGIVSAIVALAEDEVAYALMGVDTEGNRYFSGTMSSGEVRVKVEVQRGSRVILPVARDRAGYANTRLWGMADDADGASNLTADNALAYDAATGLTAAAVSTVAPADADAARTLYAIWDSAAFTYYVKLVDDRSAYQQNSDYIAVIPEVSVSPTTLDVVYDTPLLNAVNTVRTVKAPAKEGLVFTGFWTGLDEHALAGGVQVTDGADAQGNVTERAVYPWRIIPQKQSDGTWVDAATATPLTVEEVSSVTVGDNVIAAEEGSTIPLISLYAGWSLPVIDVSFDLNLTQADLTEADGALEDLPVPATQANKQVNVTPLDATVRVPKAVENFRFLGFYDQPVHGAKYYENDGTLCVDGTVWSDYENTTLYAHWAYDLVLDENTAARRATDSVELRGKVTDETGQEKTLVAGTDDNGDPDRTMRLEVVKGEQIRLHDPAADAEAVASLADRLRKGADGSFMKAGYTFRGYYDRQNWATGGTRYAEADFAAQPALTFHNKAITLYMAWESESYELVFDQTWKTEEGTILDPASADLQAKGARLGDVSNNQAANFDHMLNAVPTKDGVVQTPYLPGWDFKGFYVHRKDGSQVCYIDASGNPSGVWQDTYETVNEVAGDAGGIVLRAHYEHRPLTVSFDMNGAPGNVPAAQTLYYGQALNSSVAKPSFHGHTFLGWYYCEHVSETNHEFPCGDCVKYYDSDGSNASAECQRTWDIDGDGTLYAAWEARSDYDIYWMRNTSASDTEVISETKGQTFGAKLDPPEAKRPGYQFQGWWTAPQNGVQVTADTVFGSATAPAPANTTIVRYYAHWGAPEDFLITLDPGVGGTFDSDPNRYLIEGKGATSNAYDITSYEDATMPQPFNVRTRLAEYGAYVFKGWKEVIPDPIPDGFVPIEEASLKVNVLPAGVTGTHTLVAQWDITVFQLDFLTYDPDLTDPSLPGYEANEYFKESAQLYTDATLNAPAASTWHYAASPTDNPLVFSEAIPFPIADVHGYEFQGWYEQGDDPSTARKDLAIAPSAPKNSVYIASFVPIVYTVHFVVNDGEETVEPAKVAYDSTFVLPEVVSRTALGGAVADEEKNIVTAEDAKAYQGYWGNVVKDYAPDHYAWQPQTELLVNDLIGAEGTVLYDPEGATGVLDRTHVNVYAQYLENYSFTVPLRANIMVATDNQDAEVKVFTGAIAKTSSGGRSYKVEAIVSDIVEGDGGSVPAANDNPGTAYTFTDDFGNVRTSDVFLTLKPQDSDDVVKIALDDTVIVSGLGARGFVFDTAYPLVLDYGLAFENGTNPTQFSKHLPEVEGSSYPIARLYYTIGIV